MKVPNATSYDGGVSIQTVNESSSSAVEATYLLWHICVIVSTLCAFVSFYILVCVSIFVKRQMTDEPAQVSLVASQRKPGPTFSTVNASLSENEATTIAVRVPRPRKTRKSKIGLWMHKAFLFTVLSNFLRIIVEQLLLHLGGTSNCACNVLTKVMITFTAMSIHGCLVFLWIRQYVFYKNPLLKKIRPKSLKLISFGTYVEMVITVIVALVLHLWWRNYDSSDGVCRPSLGSRKVSVFLPFGFMVVSTASIQMSLTFLFVYPIVSHNKQMKNRSRRVEREASGKECRSRSTARLIRCVKRALVGCTVGVTTDVVGALVAIWLPEDMPVFVLSVLYELNNILNISCLFYTYVDWRNIIMPWRGFQQETQLPRTVSDTAAVTEKTIKR